MQAQNTVTQSTMDQPTSSPSDEELMVLYSKGDSSAFEILFARHKSSVYAFIRGFITMESMVDDIFQSVFMRVIKARSTYKPTARFTTWLFTITRSVCIDALRKKNRATVISLCRPSSSETDSNPIDFPDSSQNPREHSYQQDVQQAIEASLHTLPEEQREIVLLREKTDLTFEEIGELVGCSANTVKSRMHYALLAIRKELDARGFTSL